MYNGVSLCNKLQFNKNLTEYEDQVPVVHVVPRLDIQCSAVSEINKNTSQLRLVFVTVAQGGLNVEVLPHVQSTCKCRDTLCGNGQNTYT